MRANAALPGRISWAATAGATAYQLQVQRNGGRWSNVVLASATSRTATLLYDQDSRYRARLRVKSLAGAWGPWEYNTPVSTAFDQETSSRIRYSGTWTHSKSVGASGRFVRFRSVPGSTASFTFSGLAVAWVAPRGLSRGSAAIYMDGVYRTTISLYDSSELARSIAFAASFTTAGSHTITVKALGTAGHPRIDVDAFAVLR
jgi:hypothetical protein